MIKQIIDKFNSLEEKIKTIMKYGFKFSFAVCILSILILLTYQFYSYPDLYYIGLSVFRLSLFFAIEFIICGLAMDTIKKQMC